MYSIIIFGTGSSAEAIVSQLNNNKASIIAFIDNNIEKQGMLIHGIPVHAPQSLKDNDFSYDYIIIASQFVSFIYNQLLELGVDSRKIIPIYSELHTSQIKEYIDNILNDMTYNDNHEIKRISMVSINPSGCNSRALYHLAPGYIKDKYELVLREKGSLDNVEDDAVITTHRNVALKGNKINIEMWHGFPLKGMGRMNRNVNQEDTGSSENWSSAHLISSYSDIYTTLMNACFPTNVTQYTVTGMPRNDYLYRSKGKDGIVKIFGDVIKDRTIVYYLPTFRKKTTYSTRNFEEGNRIWNNTFGFEQFDEVKFTNFLERHNILLVCKQHAFEEAVYSHVISDYMRNHVLQLTNQALEEQNLDLYEVLNACDVLITDYSSVYFDYLLLDRPIIFTPLDIEDYRKTRGFLLEPYDFWTPGEHAMSQEGLEKSLLLALSDPKAHAKQREVVRNIIHTYRDGCSTERVWRCIDELISNYRTR
ncbi:CDP-glycerol glycerophosphotransferase family protein [Paenibacillus sp. MER TA 81-3]|uniref:CDP-glycerol glycerophosphotransferase family protein n=1 Tax=Paenibacillus sp. MER TA 81-3 TaxID=2939573 RepID=UPI0020424496|nr:CDP-glycerol glycerophosphotransferase family protein [Paenibacillus sp. MER TA 81-3]MCM3338748.1 CDP-glycerol glycerophosphotransferase family protein [Paenibacillus sp. MER TA 81-3]